MATIIIICVAIIVILLILLMIKATKRKKMEYKADEKTNVTLDPARNPIRKWFI